MDVVLANAGVGIMRPEVDEATAFRDQLDVNLTGVWNTVQAAAPLMIAQSRGGAVVLTSSVMGLTGRGSDGHGGMDGYVASKHGGEEPVAEPKPVDDVANLFLASDEARYVTGVAMAVDAGMLVR